jgi:single-stranded-DNA-specific exonuclease
MRWILKEVEPHEDLPGPRGLPRLVHRLLRSRGIHDEHDARRFLNPRIEDLLDPAPLPDIVTAIERLDRAVDRGEMIFLFGDYDVDGIASTALLCRCLRSIGGRLTVRLPERFSDGYGLSTAILEEVRSSGATLLVMADSGTNAIDEVGRARAMGIDVVILDHHQPGETLPDATALVNPWRADSSYPFPDLCASGVVTKLLAGLCARRAARGAPTTDPMALLDLTSLGTLADSVSLQGENRILVRQGLRILRGDPRPALCALLDRAGIAPGRVTSTDLAFQVVPRLNAAGRLGQAARSLELLLSDDPDRCYRLAGVLDEANERRKKLLDEVVVDAMARAGQGDAVERGEPLVLESERWHAGVVGIAAARLAERFGVPVLLLASDGTLSRGSGRGPAGVDLLEIVRGASGPLQRFGGHRSAVGLTMETADFPKFQEAVRASFRALPSPPRRREPGIEVDARASLEEIDRGFLDWLDRFEPFGSGNQEPVLAVRGKMAGPVRVLKDRHVRFDLTDRGTRRECIGFDLSTRLGSVLGRNSGDLHVAAVATRNLYRGEERIQLTVKDVVEHDPFGDH